MITREWTASNGDRFKIMVEEQSWSEMTEEQKRDRVSAHIYMQVEKVKVPIPSVMTEIEVRQ